MEKTPIIEKAEACLRCEAQAIEALVPRLGEAFLSAVESIRACKGKVVVTGVGNSDAEASLSKNILPALKISG